MKKTITWLLMAIAVFPFVYSPYMLGAYTSPKSILLRGVAFFVALCATITLLKNKKEGDVIYEKIQRLIKDPIFISLSAGMLLLGLSTIFAFDRAAAFFGELQRTEGFITLFALYVLYGAFRIFFEAKEWRTFTIMTSSAPLILCCIQLINLGKGIARPDALSGNPTFLAGYYLFALFMALDLVRQGIMAKKSGLAWLGGISAFITLFGIMLTGTRASLFGVILGLLVVAVASLVWGKGVLIGQRSMRTIAGSFLAACMLFALILGLTWNAAIWKKVPGISRVVQTSTKESSTNSSRLLFAEQSLTYFGREGFTRAVIGWGWDNYTFFWTKHYNPKIFYYDTGVADRAHNKLIDMLIMTGVLGLIAYLVLWFFVLREVWKLAKHDFATAIPFIFVMPAYIFFLLTTFDMPMIQVYFFASLAYLYYIKSNSYDISR